MPYEKTDTDLGCSIILCNENNCGYCNIDEDVDDLTPNDLKCDYCTVPKVIEFSSSEELESFVKETKNDMGVGLIVLNSASLKIFTSQLKIKDKKFLSLVQANDKEIEQYDFYPSVDGGVGVVSKNQLSLL